MITISITCDAPRCFKAARLYRRSGDDGWRPTEGVPIEELSKTGTLHACFVVDAHLIDQAQPWPVVSAP